MCVYYHVFSTIMNHAVHQFHSDFCSNTRVLVSVSSLKTTQWIHGNTAFINSLFHIGLYRGFTWEIMSHVTKSPYTLGYKHPFIRYVRVPRVSGFWFATYFMKQNITAPRAGSRFLFRRLPSWPRSTAKIPCWWTSADAWVVFKPPRDWKAGIESINMVILVGGLEHLDYFSGWWFGIHVLWLSIYIYILGMSSSQLTKSIIFQRGI